MASKAKTQEQEAVEDVEEFFEPQAPGTPEPEFPLPEGYENQTVGFQRAYAHARKHGNGDKAALLYAESQAHTFEETGEEE